MLKNLDNSLKYSEIKKIVWAFADLVRDKGNGTVEDYSKVVLPTCLVKRTLDLQKEFNESDAGKREMEAIFLGLEEDPTSSLVSLNTNSYRFFDMPAILAAGKNPAVIAITWEDIIAFPNNANKDEVYVGAHKDATGLPVLAFGLKYKTRAKNFVELMFEVSDCFNQKMHHVLTTFEFKRLLIEKEIVPQDDFIKVCKEELSKFEFNNKNITTDMFSDIYMDLIGRFAHDSGKKGGEFFTPTKLVYWGWSLLNPKRIAKDYLTGKLPHIRIGDPTSGSNTFLTSGYDIIKQAVSDVITTDEQFKDCKIENSNFSFYGQELKAYQYCLGLINMIFHGIDDRYNRGIEIKDQNANVIDKYTKGIGRADLSNTFNFVVANPPYGTKNYGIEYATDNAGAVDDRRWKYGVPLKSEGEMAFLMTIYDMLNASGKAVVIMPLGTLFRESGKVFREKLIREDVVEGIVVCPGNMFLTTQIPVAFWILNKNKDEADRGKVFMVNASQDFEKVGKFNDPQLEASQDAYLNRKEIADYSGYVSLETLEKAGFNLSVQRYFSILEEKTEIDFSTLESEISSLEDAIYERKGSLNALLKQASRLVLTAQGTVELGDASSEGGKNE